MELYEADFNDDDYKAINSEYSKAFSVNNQATINPSGGNYIYSKVCHTHSNFEEKFQNYNADVSSQLEEQKNYIVKLLSEWDSDNFLSDNITLCQSSTAASTIVLAFLISKGVKTIILETPYYFASYYQAKRMGLNVIRIPTYYEEEFQLKIDKKVLINNTCAVWMTQPRMGLGINQDEKRLKEIFNSLSSKDFIIIDEASEQLFPSPLSGISPRLNPQIIKIRNLFKGLGVNGIKMACIIHHYNYRDIIEHEMSIFSSSLDVYSIEHAIRLGDDIQKFKELLALSNMQVSELKKKVEKSILGTSIYLSKIVNGYIGCAMIEYNSTKLTEKEKKRRLIEYCIKNNVEIILGSSMGFAKHNNKEFIRLNYFNKDLNILKGLKIISDFDLLK